MRIIGLYGHSNCGKSATLNMLKELLRDAGKSISSKPHPQSDTPETFEYNGLIVCVAPGGDTREIVEANCRYFKTKKCDVAISATRTRWGSAEALNEFASSVGVNNVVVDGYREADGKFHINFGYGGSLDNWYDIPDPNFYYGLTKLEGIILNIIPTHTAVREYSRQQPLEVYPNPAADILYVKNLPCEQMDYSIFNVLGQMVATGSSSGTISIAELENGLYFLQIKGDNFLKTAKIMVE